MLRRVSITFASFLALALFSVVSSGIRAEAAVSALEELRAAKPPFFLSTEFAVSYRNDPMRHEVAYSGKPVEISGRITGFYRREEILGHHNVRVVQLEGIRTGVLDGVFLEFLVPDDRLQEFTGLGMGKRIRVRGIYLGQSHLPHDFFDGLVFSPCVLAPEGPRGDAGPIVKKAISAYYAKDFAAARESALEAVALDPGCSDAYSVLGGCADAGKDYALAYGYFCAAYDLDPSQEVNLYNMGRVLITVGDKNGAAAVLEQMKQKHPHSGWTAKLGKAYALDSR